MVDGVGSAFGSRSLLGANGTEANEEFVVDEKQEEIIAEDVMDDVLSNNRKMFKGGKILENLKNTLSDIFDENDVKM